MGRPARSETIATRFTKEETQRVSSAAAKRGLTVREWAREIMLQAADGTQTESALFTEIISLRLMLNDVLRTVATEEKLMTKETFALIQIEVRNTKHEVARDVLTEYATSKKK